MYWVDYEGNAVLRRTLNPGEGYLEHTYATHCWILHEKLSDEYVLIILGTESSDAQQRYSLGKK